MKNLCVLVFVLQLLAQAVLLDSPAQVVVLQVLDSGLHLVQEPLQFRGSLRLLGCLAHVLLLLLPDTITEEPSESFRSVF